MSALQAVFKEVPLSSEQQRQWSETMMLMLFKAPGFRHLFYDLFSFKKHGGAEDVLFSGDLPTAATDGCIIAVNPDWFFKLKLTNRAFVLCHEIQHNVYSDYQIGAAQAMKGDIQMPDGSHMPYRDDLMQKACDYRINPLLVDSRLGTPPGPETPHPALLDPDIANAKSSVFEAYKKLYDADQGNKPGKPGSGPDPQKKPGSGPPQGGMDELLMPGALLGTTPQNAPTPNPQKLLVALKIAKDLQEKCGTMSADMQRMFRDFLEPQVPWTDHILATVNRCVGSGGYTWRRPNRRFIGRDLYLPSRTGFNAGWLVAWGDTSGSVDENDLNRYMGEGAAILNDCRPKRMTILWGDSKIKYIDEVTDESDLHTIKCRGVGGGGGTSVLPIFKWIAEQDEVPDMFLGFTDGFVGKFPKEPSFPVIWADISNKDHYPWGEVVRIKPPR